MEDIKTNEVVEQVDDTAKYIDQIKQLKANTVSRSDYDRVRDENKKLLESLVNGSTNENASPEATKPSAQELREKLYGKGSSKLSDLEYVEGVLALRDTLLEEEGVDHFIPAGKKYSPDYNDQYVAQKVYDGLKHCVEVADGDNEVFIQEVTRITADTGMPIKNFKRRK